MTFFEKLKSGLLEQKFDQSKFDACLFMNDDIWVFLLIILFVQALRKKNSKNKSTVLCYNQTKFQLQKK